MGINLIPQDMVFVQGGTFQMGDRYNEGDSDELPLHNVTLSSFYIGKYEVTQAEYQAVMGNNPSYFSGDNKPVEQVTWYDAIKYCNKKSINEGLTPCYSVNGDIIPDNWGNSFAPDVDWNTNGYRLPTEAEWEYAARGGIHESDNYRYAGCNWTSDLPNYAWYYPYSNNQTHEVGTKLPNQLGIYDMSGNVGEWCWDWYGSYNSNSQTNPHGPDNGSEHLGRGGALYSGNINCRVAYRISLSPDYFNNGIGFRVCRAKP